MAYLIYLLYIKYRPWDSIKAERAVSVEPSGPAWPILKFLFQNKKGIIKKKASFGKLYEPILGYISKIDRKHN